MAGERTPREDTATLSGLTWHQQCRAARVVASASVDAEDCAQLLAALGLGLADWSSLDDPRPLT